MHFITGCTNNIQKILVVQQLFEYNKQIYFPLNGKQEITVTLFTSELYSCTPLLRTHHPSIPMTMTARERSLLASSVDHEWTTEEEIQLFYAMGALKPVGVNRHFYIACIAERLSRSLNRNYSTESVWIHLRTLYNFEAVDESEPLPFPNEEKEFSLPEAEFSSLLSKKRAGFSEEIRPNCEGPPSIIAVVTDNTNKDKTPSQSKLPPSNTKELDKKLAAKLSEAPPKRTPKRTRGSMSLESNSPSTTPPPLPVQSNKRRRI